MPGFIIIMFAEGDTVKVRAGIIRIQNFIVKSILISAMTSGIAPQLQLKGFSQVEY